MRDHHAERFESLSQLSGGLAHDFNNLLTIIQGNLQALEATDTVQAASDCRPLVTAAMRACQRGAELTRKLLAVSRRQPLAPAPVDVDVLLRSLLTMLERTLDARVRIELTVAPACPPCIADPVLLQAALLNIALNARDAMPDGGRLDFSAGPCESLPPGLRADLGAGSRRLARYLAIGIRDSGCGMSAEVRDRALEPFFTTKATGRGTGLGLSTAYGFVKQSHGAMTIDSAPGRGCCVTLYLPLERRAAPRSTPVRALRAGQLRGMSVMLQDDDLEVLAIVLRFLRELGCVVRAYGSAEHVLQALEHETAPALLLTDVVPGQGMCGTELARIVATRWPGVAVLLMSGELADSVDTQDNGTPVPRMLPKPFNREELARAMLEALAQASTRPG